MRSVIAFFNNKRTVRDNQIRTDLYCNLEKKSSCKFQKPQNADPKADPECSEIIMQIVFE